MGTGNNNKADCFQCVHFAITWEPKFPRCCKLFGFKTAKMPSAAVLESSGEPCAGFQSKKKPKRGITTGWEA